MHAMLFCSLMLIGQQVADNSVRLVVGYDQSASCKAMFPVLARVRSGGYDVVYVDLKAEKSRKYLEAFELSTVKQLPCYIMYIGHEAWEKDEGPMTAGELEQWFYRARIEKRSPTKAQPQQQRAYLQNDPANMVYLRRGLSAPSCGMAWCMSHRYEVLEYVNGYGQVVGRPNQ